MTLAVFPPGTLNNELDVFPPATPSGGGGTPASPDRSIQWNNSGAFGGDARLLFDDTNKVARGNFSSQAGSIRTVAGTTDTLAVTDNGGSVQYSSASAVTVTVPSGLTAAFTCLLVQLGAGKVTVVAGAGATVNGTPSLGLAAQYAAGALLPTATTDVYVLTGYLA